MVHRNYFKDSEFNCKCGECGLGIKEMNKTTIMRLNIARGISNVPYVLNSAMRCPSHNIVEGGSPTSSHLFGYAVDIRVLNGSYRWKILNGLWEAKFRRIGIGKTFIHADDDPNKPAGVVWLY